MSENNSRARASPNAAPSVTGKANRIVGKMASLRVWIAILSLVFAGLILSFKAYQIASGTGQVTKDATENPEKKNPSAMVYAIVALIAFALAFVFYHYRRSETLAAFLFVSNIMD